MPKQVDDSGYVVGENLAATPGAVVFRSEVLELLQYAPATPTVRTSRCLVIPPQINKVLLHRPRPRPQPHRARGGPRTDLLRGVLAEPGPAQGDWDLDTYVTALLEATDVVRQISGSDELITLGLCAVASPPPPCCPTWPSTIRAGSGPARSR